MGYELIITEKPNAAKKIAEALADSKPVSKKINSVTYYELNHNGEEIKVVCAVGHLYTVTEKEKKKTWTYPVFDIKWIASSEVNKDSAFTKKYLNVIKKLAKDAEKFTVATDYDIEGEVIGYNIIRYACNQKDSRRMKFSTLTKPDLIEAYSKLSSNLIKGQVDAGVTRHELDWLYGINLSRALTLSIKNSGGGFKILSSGRVQGPALKLVVDKEKEIKKFVATPYWQIELLGKKKSTEFIANHKVDKFTDEKKANEVYCLVKDEKQATVDEVKRNKYKQAPPTPFDLTSLQMEAHRTLGISPKQTLEIAQTLYTEGMISYPRTSSQKLPKIIGYEKILKSISKQGMFKELCNRLLSKGNLKPNEGKKTDDAHPAIYPTGIIKALEGRNHSLYELIVRRFLAVFSDPATRETMSIIFDVKKESFLLKGTKTLEPGWHEFYGRFVQQKEEELPNFDEGELVDVKKFNLEKKFTKPPNRYTPASIIRELEKRNLGTKATRAQIIENLFDRGYVHEKSIEATELGIKTCDVLEKHSPLILDENLTRHFEEEMEKLRHEKLTREQVLDEATNILTKILDDFKRKEKEIGTELSSANKETINEATNVGKCVKCGDGDLIIRRGKFGQFIACNKYPDCKTTFSLPKAKIKPAKKNCETCSYPLINVQMPRRKAEDICINPDCKTKKSDEEEIDVNGKTCPKCGSGLVVKNGFYGKFLACPGYPKCKHIEKLSKKDSNEKDKN